MRSPRFHHRRAQAPPWSLVAAVALLGCAGAATQQVGYTPIDPPAAQSPAPRLVVEPFADGRAPRAYPEQDNAFWLLLPFVPPVSLDYERLDESRAAERLIGGALPTSEDLFEVQLARAVAADLAASDLFTDVQLATLPSAAGGAEAPPHPDADLVLGGTIVSTRLTSTTTSYFLGMPGVLLWLTGVPNGRNTIEMAIDLALRDRDGAVLWQYPLQADATRLAVLYAPGHRLSTGAGSVSIPRYGGNDDGIDPDSLWAFHSEALRTGMAAARRSLADYLAAAQ